MSQVVVSKMDKTNFDEIIVDMDFEDVADMLNKIFEMDSNDHHRGINPRRYPFVPLKHFHRRLAFLVREMTGIEVVPTEIRHGVFDAPVLVYRNTNIDKLTELMLTLGLIDSTLFEPEKYAPNDPKAKYATTTPIKHYRICIQYCRQ